MTVQVSSAANRSARASPVPSRRTSQIMNDSMHSAISRSDDAESRDRLVSEDHEIGNITNYYSPVDGVSHQSSPGTSPVPEIVYTQQDPAEEKLRQRLTFFFMNPVDKFIAK